MTANFSGEIVEKIPISAIQLCSTAADLQKQKEILLVLTKPSEGAELYCFTCLATWAREIRDDINSAIKDAKKNSSSRPGTLSRQKQRRELEGKGPFCFILAQSFYKQPEALPTGRMEF